MKEKQAAKGIFLIVAGALLWSTNGVIVKWLSVDSFLLIGIRSLIAGIVLLPFLRPKKLPINRYTILMFLSYPALSMGIVLALDLTNPTIAIATQYTAPIWMFIASRFRKQSYDKKELIPLGCLMAGLLFFISSGAGTITMLGNIYALSTGISFAVLTYSSKHVCRDNPLGAVSLSNLLTALIIFTFFQDIRNITTVPASDWPFFLFLGIFQLGLGYALYYNGLRYTTPQLAAMVTPVEIVLGPIWIILFLQEYPDLCAIAGFLLIIASIIIESLRIRKT